MTTLTQSSSPTWEEVGIDSVAVERFIQPLLSGTVDEADLYFQKEQQESFSLEDGIVKSGSFGIDQGVGIRAVSGQKTGFAYTDDLVPEAIEQAVMAARSIAKSGQSHSTKIQRISGINPLYTSENPLKSISAKEKIALLRQMDACARSIDTRVKQVMCHLSASYEDILIANRSGIFSDIRPLVRVGVTVVVEDAAGRRETGGAGGGGRFGFAEYFNQTPPEALAAEAVRIALVNLDARPAPAGTMPVVLGPGWPGVLLHEAVGHGLEGDFNRKGSSVFSDRIGEKVASDLVTVVDDGTMPNRRGSLTIDDEGCPTQRTVLIENGVLKGYLQDAMNARLMNTTSTGNGRRESYAYAPMPRMTNTFMLPGPHSQEEIISSVENGIFAVNFGGGQVDITSGKFVFSSSEAYRIENGKITYPVKGATLIGSGPEVMNCISMVGPDLKLDDGVGTCGKDGQSVPVGVGLPTVKVDVLTVGGTDHGA